MVSWEARSAPTLGVELKSLSGGGGLMRSLSVLLSTAALLLAGCTTRIEQTAQVSAPAASVRDEKVVLRVSLFAWIPEKEAFASWIEREFEKDNPGIDLVIHPMANAESGPVLRL